MRTFSRGAAVFAVLAAAVILVPRLAHSRPAEAKNIILMISDGAGYNVWLAASMYEGKVGSQPYDDPNWVHVACSTHPLSKASHPDGNSQEPDLVYDPVKAWDAAPGAFGSFKGYDFLMMTATDSASAGTALSTGQKTYDSAINWSNFPATTGTKITPTLAEQAKARGRSVGVVTTMLWCHATPATLGGAHNVHRKNYTEIANEMLEGDWLDVIMGAGHPRFDNAGTARDTDPNTWPYTQVGGESTWAQLVDNTHPGRWKLIRTKAEFEAIAADPNASGRILGTAEVGATLQAGRTWGNVQVPYADPLNTTVPSLATMTKGALNLLSRNPKGFYLAIEGGAVDWAIHDGQKGRMIEEQIDFNQAVQAVVNWVHAHSNWNETLLIVTADHDTGLLWGPNSAGTAFDPIVNNGPNQVPGMELNAGDHTNSLVPVYARGVGAERLLTYAKKNDPKRGRYLDNTDLYRVMQEALPEPAALGLLSIGGAALLLHRRSHPVQGPPVRT